MSGQQKRLRMEYKEREMSPWEIAEQDRVEYNDAFWDEDYNRPYERMNYSVPFDVLRIC